MGKKDIGDRGLLSKEANEALDREFEPGEGVRAIVRGTYGSAIIGTDRRAFIWKKKHLQSWPYAQLSGIDAEYGLMLSWAALRGPALDPRKPSLTTLTEDDFAVQVDKKDEAKEAVPLIAGFIAQQSQVRDWKPELEGPKGWRQSGLAQSGEQPVLEAEGNGGHLWLFEDKVRIKHFGARGLLTKGFLKGDKEIRLDQISAVQWREPGAMWLGHIQFSFLGGSTDSKPAGQDENAVMFDKGKEFAFRKIKEEIDRRLAARRQPAAPVAGVAGPSIPEQIRQLAELRDQGILTSEEFDAKKADLLARL